MNERIPVPSAGEGLRASWGAAVARAVNALGACGAAGTLVRDGACGQGFEPLPANRRERKAAEAAFPWKVFGMAKDGADGHCFEILIPDGAVHVGREAAAVGGVTAVEGSEGRYTLDCEAEISEAATLYLAVTEGEDGTEAKVVAGADAPGEDARVLSLVALARVRVDAEGEAERGVVEAQYARSTFAVDPAAADGVSLGAVTAEDAENPDALQIKDFDSDASDGGQGLAQRLKVVKNGEDDFSLEAEGGEGVFLLARVNGKIKYIPLTGASEPDADEEQRPEGGQADECGHPGGGEGEDGGVAAEDGAAHGGAGGSEEGRGGRKRGRRGGRRRRPRRRRVHELRVGSGEGQGKRSRSTAEFV